MTVTSIRQINNNSTRDIKLTTDDSGTYYLVKQGASTGSNLWIPWLPHRIHVYEWQGPTTSYELYCIYQQGDTVYFCKLTEFQYIDCKCIPDVCSTGGNRVLIISGGYPNPYNMKMESAP